MMRFNWHTFGSWMVGTVCAVIIALLFVAIPYLFGDVGLFMNAIIIWMTAIVFLSIEDC